jgi:hypothetical protein
MTHLGDARVRQLILDRIGSLRSDSPRLWGKMSVHQMMCHLTDSYTAGLGEKFVTTKTGFLQRTIVKWIALYTPLPWPKGVPTLHEMKQGAGGTPPADFEQDRDALVKIVSRFARNPGVSEWHPHPLFGRMNDTEWFRWGYLHADHHLRQFGV